MLRRVASKYSLDNYLQTKYEKLCGDEGVHFGRHFVYTNDNNMHIYQVNCNDDENSPNCHILKVLNNKTVKWEKYILTSTSKINLQVPCIMNPSIVILNDDENKNYSNAFIKYTAPVRKWNYDTEATYVENVKILTKLRINRANKQIIEGDSVDVEISNNNGYDLHGKTGENRLFRFDDECHALISQQWTNSLENWCTRYAHCKYDPIKNKFQIKHVISLKERCANLDIISYRNLLFLFESYTMSGIYHYYLRIHKYYKKKDLWTVETIDNAPPLMRYSCYVFIKGDCMVFFDGHNDGVYLFDLQTNQFTKTSWMMPVCAEFKAIKIDNEENDFLALNGFIRHLCDENDYRMLPQYLIKCIGNYYVTEEIYLLCSLVDGCVEYVFNQTTERHNFYRFRTWRFPVDILFYPDDD